VTQGEIWWALKAKTATVNQRAAGQKGRPKTGESKTLGDGKVEEASPGAPRPETQHGGKGGTDPGDVQKEVSKLVTGMMDDPWWGRGWNRKRANYTKKGKVAPHDHTGAHLHRTMKKTTQPKRRRSNR